MNVIYFLLKWIGLTTLLISGTYLIGLIVGYISFKLEQVKYVASFLTMIKNTFQKTVEVGMYLFAIVIPIAILIKLIGWGIIIASVIISFFSNLFH
jgi:hypothetical protein